MPSARLEKVHDNASFSELQTAYGELWERFQLMLRETFFADLMGSHHITPEEYDASMSEYHINFSSDRFVVMAIRVDMDLLQLFGESEPVNQESLRYVRFLIRNVVEDLVGKKNPCYVLTVQGELVALINLAEDSRTGLASVLEAAEQSTFLFEQHYDSVVSFFVSRVHTGYQEISQAYRESQSLVRYSEMIGEVVRVLQYDQRTEANIPKERVEHFDFERTLGNHIRSGDYEAARDLVHKMLGAEFGHAQPTVQVFMIRAYGLINDILHVFDSLEEQFSPDFLVELQAGPRIVNASSLSEISQELDDIFDAIIQKQQLQDTEPAWIQKAVDYMDENFTDQNLNVAGVADAVAINPVYLSRMLKKYRNIRPLEYIHEKRIEKAKLLLSQGVTVKDTLPQVGYSSALTMNRAFRKFEDTTPGTFYREK